MATERLSMRKTREILRLKWVLGRGDMKRKSLRAAKTSSVSSSAQPEPSLYEHIGPIWSESASRVTAS